MRPWFILAALALARIGFGYQFQTVATLGPDLIPRFALSYAAFGALIGAYMLLGCFVALPLGWNAAVRAKHAAHEARSGGAAGVGEASPAAAAARAAQEALAVQLLVDERRAARGQPAYYAPRLPGA